MQEIEEYRKHTKLSTSVWDDIKAHISVPWFSQEKQRVWIAVTHGKGPLPRIVQHTAECSHSFCTPSESGHVQFRGILRLKNGIMVTSSSMIC